MAINKIQDDNTYLLRLDLSSSKEYRSMLFCPTNCPHLHCSTTPVEVFSFLRRIHGETLPLSGSPAGKAGITTECGLYGRKGES